MAAQEPAPPSGLDLQAEIITRDRRIEQLRVERDAFAKNFDLLKNADTELKHELDSTRQQLLRAREENGALQRRQEEQSNHLRAQLEGQKREFEETKKRLVPPREFEMLRVRLIEELEVPYRNRFEQLQQELELSRGQFYAQRRESGLMREEFEATAALHVKEIQALQDEYELKLGECQGRLRTMQALVEDTTDKERVAALHRENLTLRANAKHLFDELEQVRSEKEAAVVAKEQQAALHAKALSEEVMAARSLLLEKEKLERRCIHLEQKLADAPRESTEQQAQRMQEESASTRNKREEMDNIIAAERNSMNAQMLQKEREAAQQHVEMKVELDSAKARIEEMREDIVKAERLYQSQRQALLQEMEEERAYIQQNADAMKGQAESQAAAMAELQAAKAEDSALAEERIAALEEEVSAAAEATGEAEARCTELQRQVDELQAQLAAIRAKEQSTTTALKSLEREHDAITVAHADGVAENKGLRAVHDAAAERTAFMAKIDALKKALAKEHARAKMAVRQGEENKKKARAEVSRLQQQLKLLMTRIRSSEQQLTKRALRGINGPGLENIQGTYRVATPAAAATAAVNESGGFSESEPEPR